MNSKRIIIIGGGFAGVKCTQELKRSLPDAEIVLFSIENHIVFTPLLAEVVGSSLNPLDVVVPLRQLLPGVHCRTEEVTVVDVDRNEVEFRGDDAPVSRLRYDHLVLACGSVANLGAVRGMADHAFALKNIGAAVALRSHVMEQLERAETCADAERRRWHLSFIVVGGGFSGVEAAGEINDLVRESAKYFQNFRASDVSVTLIHSRDQILPEIGNELREFARQKMQRRGVRIILNASVTSATAEGVRLASGESVRGGTVVCTVGCSPSPLIEKLPSQKEHGRLVTDRDMRVRTFPNIWAIGDCAHIVNAHDGKPCAPTGQFAERQGRQCAQNILRELQAKQTRPFSFKPLGQLCSLGGHSGVAEFLGMHLSGLIAWFFWRSVYLFKLPTWARRLQVGFNWAWLLCFPRDLAHMRARQTDRVSRAHYQTGDFIIRHGEPPTHFYVVEHGEVEVIRPNGEVIVVLGPGSFFGERALLNNAPREASVRARTPVQVVVMGRNVFTQMSAALAPLRDALAQTLNRRVVDPWKNEPRAYELLRRIPVHEIMETVPRPLLKPSATLRETGQAFADHPNEFFLVSGDGKMLDGVVTMTDLLRASSSGAGPDTPVREFMVHQPVAIAATDTAAVASTTLRESRLKTLPVVDRTDSRRLVGCLRARRLMVHVLKELGEEDHSVSIPMGEMTEAWDRTMLDSRSRNGLQTSLAEAG